MLRSYQSDDEFVAVNSVHMGIDKVTIDDSHFQIGDTSRSFEYINYKKIISGQYVSKKWYFEDEYIPVMVFEFIMTENGSHAVRTARTYV